MGATPEKTVPVDLHDDELVEIDVASINGGHYVFPRVEWKVIWSLLRDDNLHGLTILTFVNRDQSMLIIQTSTIKSISVNGQIYWSRRVGA